MARKLFTEAAAPQFLERLPQVSQNLSFFAQILIAIRTPDG
jgi:hypothetical protein